jgi:hypothetical protein
VKQPGVNGEEYVPDLREIWDFLVGFKEATEAGFDRLTREFAIVKSDVGTLKSDVAIIKSDIVDIRLHLERIDRRLLRLDDRVSSLEACTAASS